MPTLITGNWAVTQQRNTLLLSSFCGSVDAKLSEESDVTTLYTTADGSDTMRDYLQNYVLITSAINLKAGTGEWSSVCGTRSIVKMKSQHKRIENQCLYS